MDAVEISRRASLRTLARSTTVGAWLATGLALGCRPRGPISGELQQIWGRRGISEGRFEKPRAMAIDQNDEIYIVDMTARIQVFTPEGKYLRGWRTPVFKNGKPSGLSITRDGTVLVADTHYFRMLCYTPQGELLRERTIGGTHGPKPGEFGFVTDAVQDSQGNVYIAEYGEYDRIQKFAPDGQFILQWGSHGMNPGQFLRPQNLVIDDQDRIWVADACNHRIQVFDVEGTLLTTWGRQGRKPGDLWYPYDLTFDRDGNLYICEFGNHRVQKFTRDGKSLGLWGGHGRGEGQLHCPWALVTDRRNRVHVLDTNNHRVQQIVL